ncbi:MAG: phosphohydrolase [Deltaproteobacteria bacterium CG03_land_8_20_14_0_80_45_14]|nr:MAG: phosphohydrolase [Deltaproteobacteria bacterium CG03_land_8_20_14_0_80_45_14]
MIKASIKKFILDLPFLKTPNDLRDRSWLERIKTPSYQKWFIGIGIAIIFTLLLSPSLTLHLKEYKVGDIATKEIKSTQDLLVEDEKSTQEKKAEAERSVLSVYDYDPMVLSDAEYRIRTIFGSLAASPPTGEKGNDQNAMRRKEWDSTLRLPLTQREWQVLEKERFNPAIGEAALRLVAPILKKGVVNDKDLLDPDADRGIVIRNIQTREERKSFPPFGFFDFKEAKAKVRSQADLPSPIKGKELSPVVLKMAEHFLRPNLTFNKDETEGQKTKAREKVTSVYFQVKRGEMILRAGERVQEEHLLKIKSLRKAQERTHLLAILIGMGLLTFLILASLYQFSTQNIRKIALSQKDILFFSTTLVGIIAFLKLFQLSTDVLGGEFFSIPSSSYLYLFPIATSAMLVRIVLNSEVAIVFTLLASYFSAALMGNQLFYFIFTFVGSVIGAHKVARCEQRSILIKAGITVGGINILMILSYNLISGNPFKMTLLSDLMMGFLGGVLASVLVLGIAPIIESLFGYTTDIKLLELANMDHPILKDLILQAPGTYHHSIIVGSLVEAAAKSISANPLLARVSAYYHDIGKLKKPLYFIENVGGGENKHDHLTPTMSSLILISHVKDGVEMARENRLGERIGHIIQQHHGTSLISYFYQKAKEKENPEMELINENDFRYPGPKPQTKEAGIVMLADSVEAASRALAEPTPSRIKGLVQRITNNIFLDGQLEECELTLKDLQKIQESFNRILTAIFHHRIDYPIPTSSESPKKRNDEDLDSKSTKTYPFKLKKNKKGGPKDIDRIGAS